MQSGFWNEYKVTCAVAGGINGVQEDRQGAQKSYLANPYERRQIQTVF